MPLLRHFCRMEWLRVQQLSTEREGIPVLEAISFSLDRGRKLAIAGETGSGKTTLLKAIGGLVQPLSGIVYFKGEPVPGPKDKLIPGHPRMAYLSQQYELRNHYRVEEELAYTNQIGTDKARRIFEICRVDHLLKRYTHQLSGGERQRIATARVLVAQPELLLLDEPFSNLDPLHKRTMQDVVQAIGAELGISAILVDHEPKDTLSWADEILVLRNGKMVQMDDPQTIYYMPMDAYVAGLFGEFNIVKGALCEELMGKSTHILLRPEQLELCPSHIPGPKARFLRRKFYGSITLAEVICQGEHLFAFPGNADSKEGEMVTIRLRNA